MKPILAVATVIFAVYALGSITAEKATVNLLFAVVVVLARIGEAIERGRRP